MALKLFVRQPFTESGNKEQALIQGALDEILSQSGHPTPIEILTGSSAESEETFRQSFEQKTGLKFTPKNFRDYRLGLMKHADAMIVIRTSLSESGAFEVAHNIFSGLKLPIFFAVWSQTPIKTTLLRELDDLCMVRYHHFDTPTDLRNYLAKFFAQTLANAKNAE